MRSFWSFLTLAARVLLKVQLLVGPRSAELLCLYSCPQGACLTHCSTIPNDARAAVLANTLIYCGVVSAVSSTSCRGCSLLYPDDTISSI